MHSTWSPPDLTPFHLCTSHPPSTVLCSAWTPLREVGHPPSQNWPLSLLGTRATLCILPAIITPGTLYYNYFQGSVSSAMSSLSLCPKSLPGAWNNFKNSIIQKYHRGQANFRNLRHKYLALTVHQGVVVHKDSMTFIFPLYSLYTLTRPAAPVMSFPILYILFHSSFCSLLLPLWLFDEYMSPGNRL